MDYLRPSENKVAFIFYHPAISTDHSAYDVHCPGIQSLLIRSQGNREKLLNAAKRSRNRGKMTSFFFRLLKLAAQEVELFYDFLIVGLNILTGEFMHLFFYLLAGHRTRNAPSFISWACPVDLSRMVESNCSNTNTLLIPFTKIKFLKIYE